MTDGTGHINLQSLPSTIQQDSHSNGNSSAMWVLQDGDGYKYSYSPCQGFQSATWRDLAVSCL